jgi:hypothetical protein
MLISLRTAAATLKKIIWHGAPSHIICFGDSLGDNLLLTTLCQALNKRGDRKIWVKSDHDFLFTNNPNITLVLPFKTLLSTAILNVFKIETVYPKYTAYSAATDRDEVPEKHIVLKMADTLDLKGEIPNKPVLCLESDEERKGRFALGKIVIATSTSGARFPMQNKEWLPERYQQIVDRFANRYEFIQLGANEDFPLSGVLDLRGKTTIRESAAILKNCLLLVTHVGFLMHLARAMDCRAVIIYGGREKPRQSGYPCFGNISSDTECSPCWLHNRCDYQKKCMTMISADIVQEAMSEQLKLQSVPLTTDLLYNK